MSSLFQFFSGIICKAIVNTITFFYSLVMAAFDGMSTVRNAITYKLSEYYAHRDIPATALTLKCIQNTESAHVGPKRIDDSIEKLEEEPQTNDESLSEAADGSNQSESKMMINQNESKMVINQNESKMMINQNDSYVLINITDENSCQRTEENSNVMRLAIASVFLRCCDKCAAEGMPLQRDLSAGGDETGVDHNANADHDEDPPKLVVIDQTDKTFSILNTLLPEKETEDKKKDNTDGHKDEKSNDCCVDCLYFTMQCCECTIM